MSLGQGRHIVGVVDNAEGRHRNLIPMLSVGMTHAVSGADLYVRLRLNAYSLNAAYIKEESDRCWRISTAFTRLPWGQSTDVVSVGVTT